MAVNTAGETGCDRSMSWTSAPMTSQEALMCTDCSIADAPPLQGRSSTELCTEDTWVEPSMQGVYTQSGLDHRAGHPIPF